MMQRFYDPDQGQIFLGQHDPKGLFTFFEYLFTKWAISRNFY